MRRHHICTKKKRLYFSCSMCVGGWQKLSSLLSFVTIKLRRFFFSLNYTNTLFVQHRIWPDPAHAPQNTTHSSQYRQEKKNNLLFSSSTNDRRFAYDGFVLLVAYGWLAGGCSEQIFARLCGELAAMMMFCYGVDWVGGGWVWWKKSTLGRRRDVIVGAAAAAAAANNTVSTPFLLLMLIFFSAILCVRCDDDDDEDIGIVVGGSVVEREKKRERTIRAYAAMFNKMRRDDFFLGEFKKKFRCTKIWWRQSPRNQTKTRLNI